MSNASSNDDLLLLQEAFCTLDISIIRECYESTNRNIEETMEALLMISEQEHHIPESKPVGLSYERQRIEDEDARLARELSEQFMSELSVNDSADALFAKQLQQEWEESNVDSSFDQQQNVQEIGLEALSSGINIQQLLQSGLMFQGNMDAVLEQVKQSIIPVLTEQVMDMKIDSIEETVTLPVGDVDFSLAQVFLESFDIPIDQLTLRVEENTIHLHSEKIAAQIGQFSWSFNQLSFPRLKDKGTATASFSLQMDVYLQITVTPSGLAFNVTKCDVKMGKIDVKISAKKKSIVYTAVVSIAVRLLKQRLEATLAEMVVDGINTQGRRLLGGVSL